MTGDGPEAWPEADSETDVAGFRASAGGVTARFAGAQAAILRSLVSQLAELIGEGAGPAPDQAGMTPGDAAAGDDLAAQLGLAGLAAQFGVGDAAELPDDPILARLLPDAYADDPQAAGEFRRYTETGLRSGKVAAARTVLD
ncbi:MAG: DUF2017 family protein, partial [Streptosporangiaceae bacterium]